MAPTEKSQSTKNIKTVFMISLPVSVLTLMTAHILPETMKVISYICIIVSAFTLILTISMFFDLLKYIRWLENELKNQSANKKSEKTTDE